MPNYDYICNNCGLAEVQFVAYEDRDKPRYCSICNKLSMVKVWMNMPGTTRASYIDSSKTSRAKEFADIKAASKLEVEKASLPAGERAEVNKEIAARRSLKKD